MMINNLGSPVILINKIAVGIDVHLRSYAVAVVRDGVVLKKWTMPATPIQLAEKLLEEYSGYEIHSAYEAGFSGFNLHRILENAGIHNIVVNASSIAVNKRDRIKTDRRDAQKIATHLWCGMLKGIRIPSPQEELKRQLSRYREQLVKNRTRIIQQIRNKLYFHGYSISNRSVLSLKTAENLINALPENELKFCLQSLYRLWIHIKTEIGEVELALYQQASVCPFEETYRSIPGIGKVSSRILANEFGDFSQFKNEKALFSYIGLTPCEFSSGEHIRKGRISRQGKPLIRKILIEISWIAIRFDPTLKAHYSKIAIRCGGKKAIVAVARKLIGRTRAVFRKKEDYQFMKKKGISS